jgi:hypothetical protein
LYNRGQNENHDVARASFFGVLFDSPDKAEAFYFSKIRETIDKLVASGKRVIVIGPVPEVGRNVPDMLAKQQIAGQPLSSTVACGDFFERNGEVLGFLESLAGVSLVKPHEILLHDDKVSVMAEDQVLYLDDDHLSTAGAMYLKPLLENVFSSPP